MGALLAGSVLLLGITACGSGSDAATTGGGQAGQQAPTKISVGIIPTVDAVTAYIARDQGFFKEEGLEPELNVVTNPAQTIPALLSGSLDFLFMSTTSFVNAEAGGANLALAAVNSSSGPDFQAFAVKPDSPLRTPADLAGAKVGTTAIGGACDLLLKAKLAAIGATGKPEFVQVPINNQGQALDKGDIDVACLLEPFRTSAIQSMNARTLYDPFAAGEEFENTPLDMWVTGCSQAKDKPAVLNGFKAAMAKAAAYAEANPEKALAAAQQLTRTPSEILKDVKMPKLVGAVTPEGVAGIQKWADLMLSNNAIKDKVDAQKAVGAETC